MFGDQRHRQRGGVGPRRRLGRRNDVPVVHQRVRRECAQGGAHHPITHGPTRDLVAHGGDLAGELQPRGEGRHVSAGGVVRALKHPEIRSVQSGGTDANEQLTGPRARHVDLASLPLGAGSARQCDHLLLIDAPRRVSR